MQCPFCNSETSVKGTRVVEDGTKIVRQRRCDQGHRFRTTETVGELLVKKGAGHLEPFSRAKVARGISTALYKWLPEKEAIASGWEASKTVERKLLERIREEESLEVDPRDIGKLVLEELKEINWFGWLSYQGVFMKERKDVGEAKCADVQAEIENLLDEILTIPRRDEA
jgi:transcriptional repressor NrdR